MTRTANPSSGKTILCIDDQQEFLDALRLLLEREGHRILTCTSGKVGLQVLEYENVDLLLIDYFMPEMSAEDTLREIRNPALPVILLTGYASEKPVVETIRKLNIQGYCDKNRGPEEVLLWVEIGLRFSKLTIELEQKERLSRKVLSTPQFAIDAPQVEQSLENILQQAANQLDLKQMIVALTDSPTLENPIGIAQATTSEFHSADLRVASQFGSFGKIGQKLSTLMLPGLLEDIEACPPDEEVLLEDGPAIFPIQAGKQIVGRFFVSPAPPLESADWDLLSFYAKQISLTLGYHRSLATN